jgi:uncharacterized protein YegL
MSDPFDLESAVEFAENPEPRCACVLLLDTSGSMNGRPIAALAEGLKALLYDLQLDPVAARRVELALVTFDSSVNVCQDFTAPDRMEPPTLVASGQTHMAEAIETALALVERRKELYRANDITYYRPWVFMITDGEPQGESASEVQRAIAAVRRAEEERRAAFFAVGVEGANMKRLKQISVRAPQRLGGLDFRELFVWLSRSMQTIAHSRPEDRIALPPAGWAEL